MITVSEGFRVAAINGSVKTRLVISVYSADGSSVSETISNQQIVAESMILTQALCDDDNIKFGGCIANSFEIDVSCINDIRGRKITVQAYQTATMPLYPSTYLYPGATIYPGEVSYNTVFPIFTGYIFSCAFSKNRLTRHLIAYDEFFTTLNDDCADWYKSLFSSTVTLGVLRAAILMRYGIDEARSVTLPADTLIIHKMDIDELKAADILRMIAEINGVFLWINGAGKMRYIGVGESTLGDAEGYDFYIDAEAEDHAVEGFDCVDTHSIGVYDLIVSSPQNAPYNLDNPLVLTGYVASGTQTGDQFQTAWDGIVSGVSPNFQPGYTPFKLRAEARLWIEPGDPVSFDIHWYAVVITGAAETTEDRTDTVDSVVLSRRIKGIQAMTDELLAK